MGFLTTITLHNDLLGGYESNPQELGQNILDGINRANIIHERTSFGGVTVHPSRHADDTHLYLHYGNTLFSIGSLEFRSMVKSDPAFAKELIAKAKEQLQWAEKEIDKETK